MDAASCDDTLLSEADALVPVAVMSGEELLLLLLLLLLLVLTPPSLGGAVAIIDPSRSVTMDVLRKQPNTKVTRLTTCDILSCTRKRLGRTTVRHCSRAPAKAAAK